MAFLCLADQVRGVSKSGVEFPIEVTVSSFTVKGKTHFNGIIKDLSDEGNAFPLGQATATG